MTPNPGALARLEAFALEAERSRATSALMIRHGIHVGLAADLRTLFTLLKEAREVLDPFAEIWAALKDPLPQEPFAVSVDAMKCCAAYKVYAKIKEATNG